MKAGTCKHYNGSFHNTHCGAGVCYRDVTTKPDDPGCAYRKPCVKLDPNDPHDAHGLKVIAETGQPGVCDKYEEPTQAEIDASEAAMEAAMEQMLKSIPWVESIRERCKGKDDRGVDVCPICAGKIHWSCAGAYNGHVHARCETEDCLNFME